MQFLKHLILIAFACLALATQLVTAEPQFGSGRQQRPSGLNRPRPHTLPPQRPVQPNFNGPRQRF